VKRERFAAGFGFGAKTASRTKHESTLRCGKPISLSGLDLRRTAKPESRMSKRQNRSRQADAADLPTAVPGPDFSIRAAQEIPRPKDWQALQRGCVILFQAELQDPHAQEYGRNGQEQRGIDVLGRRNGDPDHFVGIQCRRLATPMKKAKILADCRAAVSIKAGLKEIIFATTCPSDVNATNAAIEVERELRGEGHDLKVVLRGRILS
jgi:hypothetical protein